MKCVLLAVLVLALQPEGAWGQTVAGPDDHKTRPYIAAALGGTLGVGVGWTVGGMVGASVADCEHVRGGELCGLSEAIIGAVMAGTIGAAAGAYIGTRISGSRVHPAIPLVASVVGIGTGFLAGAALDRGLGLPATPVYIGAAIGQGAITGLLTAALSRRRPGDDL
jgi:hypothetical protein